MTCFSSEATDVEDTVILIASFLGPLHMVELRCLSRRLRDLFTVNAFQNALAPCEDEAGHHSFFDSITNAETVDDNTITSALRLLARANTTPDQKSLKNDALVCAAKRGCGPLCAMLLEGNAEVDALDSGGCSALSLACWGGKNSAVSILLRSNANTNLPDTKGMMYTPLMTAARFGHSEVVEKLIIARADASLCTPLGETALSLASHGGHQATCHLLKGSSQGTDWRGSLLRHAKGRLGSRDAQAAFHNVIFS